jgi:hypothetical protein
MPTPSTATASCTSGMRLTSHNQMMFRKLFES